MSDYQLRTRRDVSAALVLRLALPFVYCPVVGFLVGMSYAQVLTGGRLGVGNWLALVVSSYVVLLVVAAGVLGLIPDRHDLGAASTVARLMVVVCSLAAGFLGWYLTHGARTVDGLLHLSLHLRNWLVWRF
jgi:hypothetical protein